MDITTLERGIELITDLKVHKDRLLRLQAARESIEQSEDCGHDYFIRVDYLLNDRYDGMRIDIEPDYLLRVADKEISKHKETINTIEQEIEQL